MFMEKDEKSSKKADENRFAGFVMRKAAGIYWLVDTGSSAAYREPLKCNEVGAKIWDLLKQGMSADSIAEEIAVIYEVGTEEVRSDVQDFLTRLLEYVEPGDGEPDSRLSDFY